jgi:hypothetical protein
MKTPTILLLAAFIFLGYFYAEKTKEVRSLKALLHKCDSVNAINTANFNRMQQDSATYADKFKQLYFTHKK